MSRIRKVKSFEKFSGELQKRQPELVIVQADVSPAAGLFRASQSPTVGRIGDYDHSLVYTVRMAKRDRLYEEKLFTVFQSQYG